MERRAGPFPAPTSGLSWLPQIPTSLADLAGQLRFQTLTGDQVPGQSAPPAAAPGHQPVSSSCLPPGGPCTSLHGDSSPAQPGCLHLTVQPLSSPGHGHPAPAAGLDASTSRGPLTDSFLPNTHTPLAVGETLLAPTAGTGSEAPGGPAPLGWGYQPLQGPRGGAGLDSASHPRPLPSPLPRLLLQIPCPQELEGPK